MLGTTVTVPTLDGEHEIEVARGDPARPRRGAARRRPAAARRPPPRQPAGDPQRRSSRPTSARSSARWPSASTSTLERRRTSARGRARASSAASAGPSVDPARGPVRARAGGARARRADRAGAQRGRGGARARLRRVRDLRRRGRAAGAGRDRRGGRRRDGSRSAPPRSPTTGPTAGATSTSRCWSATGSGCDPPGSRRARARSTSSSTPARPSAPAPTRPPASASSCLLELEAAGEAGGPLTDLGTGSGVLAIAAAKLGWDPIHGYDHEPPALEAAAANAAANGVELALERINLRERLPALAPTTVANMTAPILRAVAEQLRPDPERAQHPASARVSCQPSSTRSPPRSAPPAWRGRTPPGGRLGRAAASSGLRDMFPPMLYGSNDHRLQDRPLPPHPRGRAGLRTDLRLRVLLLGRAAVPAGDAGAAGGSAEDRPLPGQPGDDRAAARRHLPAAASDGAWDGSDVFVIVGFVAIIVLFGLQHGFFQPQVRKAKALAERDLEAGDTLEPRVRSGLASGSARSAASPA